MSIMDSIVDKILDNKAIFKRWLFNRPIIQHPTTSREKLQNLSRGLFGDDRLVKQAVDRVKKEGDDSLIKLVVKLHEDNKTIKAAQPQRKKC